MGNKKFGRWVVNVVIIIISLHSAFAGNKDRAGQAGASELQILPYPRIQSLVGSNVASVRGLEAMYLNVAGTAFTQRLNIIVSYIDWLKGSDISIYTFGFVTRAGEFSTIGLSVMNMSFGEIDITTVNQPEGGIGKFKPNFLNIGFSYARKFSDQIIGGALVRVISEAIADNSAQGIALDAGIQYVTGYNERLKFGIALRNVGPPMNFSGDGLTFRGNVFGSDNAITLMHRSARFELPTLLTLGGSYDFFFGENEEHIITANASFVSNAFQKDNFAAGLQYNFKNIFMIRGGFYYEENILDAMPERTTVYTGPAAGITIQVPTNKERGSFISLDYAFRATNPYSGIHNIGLRIDM